MAKQAHSRVRKRRRGCLSGCLVKIILLLGLAATIVAGYFSIPVCLTILACVLTNSLLGLGFKVYYSKKF